MNLQLLQQAAPVAGQPSLLSTMALPLLIFGIFYFVLLAPMRKQQKKTREMLGTLKKGDRVVTTGGIHGSVAQIEDKIVWVKIADTVKVKMDRSAIATIVSDSEAGSKDAAA